MSYPPLGLKRSSYTQSMDAGFGFARCTYVGPGAGVADTYGATAAVTCGSTQVALIDEIIITRTTLDSAANTTVTIRVNGAEMPFHFPSTADLAKSDVITWRPKGNLVVMPSQTLNAKSSVAGQTSIFVRFRLMEQTKAIQLGLMKGWQPVGLFTSAGLPSGTQSYLGGIATTNSDAASTGYAGAGTATGTAKVLVRGITGYSIEILGFTYTGHNYNAAADNTLLGFWDGTTGTFASNSAKIIRPYHRGANAIWSPRILIGDTHGCIQGASGAGLYIAQTANLSGATPKADFNVLYRFVKDVDVGDTTGAAGTSYTKLKKWWVNTEATPSAIGTPVALFGTVPDAVCRIRGFVFSGSCSDATLANSPFLGIGIGTTIADSNITEMLFFNSAKDAGTAAVSNTYSRDDCEVFCRTGQTPNFWSADPSGVLTRSQLVWGTFHGTGNSVSDHSKAFS